MDLDLSRAGGMSRLLRQGKASEHIIDWTGLRWLMAFPYEVQRSLAVAVAHSGTSPHVPTYVQASKEGSIRVRLRMFRRSTHAAFRARSFCDHWRGEQQRRRERSRAVGPDAAARRRKGSRPPAAASCQRRHSR